jgi:predicted NAD-dependent protein-ADP-ribosyltransferase YbiA (DUF1768 family)
MRWSIGLCLIGLLCSCSSLSSKNSEFGYPAHWWQGIPKAEMQWWEISPDSAGRGEVVLSKRNELGILSNFAETAFVYEGEKYPGIEGVWQAMKFPEGKNDERLRPGIEWSMSREEVLKLTGHAAKRAGDIGSKNMKELGINWVTWKGKRLPYRVNEKGEHYKLIRALMKAKLEQNSDVREALLSTGNLKLLPDHKVSPDDPPAWRYYDIWMELREEIWREDSP